MLMWASSVCLDFGDGILVLWMGFRFCISLSGGILVGDGMIYTIKRVLRMGSRTAQVAFVGEAREEKKLPSKPC